MNSSARRSRYWKRYWAVMDRLGAGARAAKDRYYDRLLALAGPVTWLNAGCGRHTFPEWRSGDAETVKTAGAREFGFDLDRDALKDRSDAVPTCVAAIESLPYRPESFDFVASEMVFEHLHEPQKGVAELVRVTRHGGRLLIHTVNSRHYLALMATLTPFRFHQWIVRRIEGREGIDVYPTRYEGNTEARLDALFAQQGCRKVWGGEVTDLPMCVPYPGLFWLALLWGLLELQLARLPVIGGFLRPNLLIEYVRD